MDLKTINEIKEKLCPIATGEVKLSQVAGNVMSVLEVIEKEKNVKEQMIFTKFKKPFDREIAVALFIILSDYLSNQTQENAIEFFEKIDRFKEKFME